MKKADVKPGTYVLKCDVQTPEPDRRMKRDWRKAAVVKKGTILRVRDRFLDKKPDGTFVTYLSAWTGGWSHMDVWLDRKEWAPLVDAMEPLTETPSMFLAREIGEHSGWAADILDRLVDEGTITYEVFLAAYQKERNRVDEDDSAYTSTVTAEPVAGEP